MMHIDDITITVRVIEPVLTVAAWFDCSDPFVLDDIPIQQQIEVISHGNL